MTGAESETSMSAGRDNSQEEIIEHSHTLSAEMLADLVSGENLVVLLRTDLTLHLLDL
jgi:hypothetical protein